MTMPHWKSAIRRTRSSRMPATAWRSTIPTASCKSAQYTRLKATIKNGVVESEQVEHLHTPRIAWFYDQTGDTNFTKGKIRLNIAPDGLSATGLIGGYRNWRDLYAENTFAQDGGQQGVREHEDHVALYYALRRNADGMFNDKTGKYDGISSVYRIKLSSRLCGGPRQADGHSHPGRRPLPQESVRGDQGQHHQGRGNPRTPSRCRRAPAKPSYPGMERGVRELASGDFFLKTLDRPHYPDGVGRDNRNLRSTTTATAWTRRARAGRRVQSRYRRPRSRCRRSATARPPRWRRRKSPNGLQ